MVGVVNRFSEDIDIRQRWIQRFLWIGLCVGELVILSDH